MYIYIYIHRGKRRSNRGATGDSEQCTKELFWCIDFGPLKQRSGKQNKEDKEGRAGKDGEAKGDREDEEEGRGAGRPERGAREEEEREGKEEAREAEQQEDITHKGSGGYKEQKAVKIERLSEGMEDLEGGR